MRNSIASERVVREVDRLLKESRSRDVPNGEECPLKFGISRMRPSADTQNEARTVPGSEE